MQRKFVSNLALLIFLNLLIKPFWIFGIDLSVQNTTGPASYGIYNALLSFSLLFITLLDLGITSYNNTLIAKHNQLLSKQFSGVLMLKILLAVIYMLVTLSIGLLIGYNAYQMSLLLVLGFNQVMLSFFVYLRSNLTALHLFRTESMLSVLDRALMILICGTLLWSGLFPRFRIEYFVYAQTVSYLLTCIITFSIVYQKLEYLKLRLYYIQFLLILKRSYPYALLGVLMMLYTRIDSVMIERMLPDGAEQSGIYAQGYRLLDAANMFAVLFSTLLLPMFAGMISRKEPVEKLASLGFSLLMIPAVTLACISFVFREEIIYTLYAVDHPDSPMIFGYLMLTFIPLCMLYIYGTLLTANGNLRLLNILSLCGLVLNVLLNIFLIPSYKALGATIATLITQGFIGVCLLWFSGRNFNFTSHRAQLLKLALFSVFMVVASWQLKEATGSWLINSALIISAAVIFSLATGVLDTAAMLRVVKSYRRNKPE
jgi:O-antigen/teichoic acid export membrane protein